MTKAIQKDGPSTAVFYALTGIYLLVVIAGAYGLGFFDITGKPISPSDWGSVLAGVFSPLAFLWLIYASLSQRAELELQRRELTQNNVTQGEQREEMQRQVEAMTAQAKLLEAQAAATFDPVFLLSNVYNSRGGYTFIIVNRGCEVMNAYVRGGFSVEDYNGGGTGLDPVDREVYYWSTGSEVRCLIDADPDVLHEVSIQYTRKDGASKRNIYLLSLPKASLRLAQSDQVIPSSGHK